MAVITKIDPVSQRVDGSKKFLESATNYAKEIFEKKETRPEKITEFYQILKRKIFQDNVLFTRCNLIERELKKKVIEMPPDLLVNLLLASPSKQKELEKITNDLKKIQSRLEKDYSKSDINNENEKVQDTSEQAENSSIQEESSFLKKEADFEKLPQNSQFCNAILFSVNAIMVAFLFYSLKTS